MTREEAITLINSAKLMLINPTDNEPVSDLYEALDMAIKALSQEPCRYWQNGKCNGNTEVCDDAVSIRKDVLKCRVGNIVAYNVEWLKKHWQMEMDIVCGVKPCDDAVSRDAVIDAIERVRNNHAYDEIEEIQKLPSVTPSRPTEHKQLCDDCIYFADGKGSEKCDSCELTGTNKPSRHKGRWIEEKHDVWTIGYRCSKCNWFNDDPYNYCPCCGAEMESSDANSD